MLFIIFGWKTRMKEYGATYPTRCPHCSNDIYFHLIKSRRWFKLYFIPVLPLGFASHDLVCPTCHASLHLDGRAEAKQAKQLTKATNTYQEELMGVNEYKRELRAFEVGVFGSEGGPMTVDSTKFQAGNGGGSDLLFRGLMALLFVFSLLTCVIGISELNLAGIACGILMLPYLAIRYLDPDSTTLPLAGVVKNRV